MPAGEWLWFIGLRSGRVFQISSTSASSLPSANLINPMIPDSRDLSIGEEGFLGLAFDPDIATNPSRNYVYYVRGGWGSVGLYRANVSRNSNGIYLTSNHVMVLSAGGGGHHYGGDVHFGPDGYLYMSVGEDDIGARARSAANLRGKILRIDVNSTSPLAGKLYGIPTTNPYRLAGSQPNAACYENGTSGLPDASHPCPEVYASGFRNPFRFSFDRTNGQLWLGDVGAAHEEVNVVTLGGDYGWNTQEGTTTPGGGIQAAVTELPRNDASCAGNAVIGGYAYRGAAMSWLTGQYLAADNGTGKIYAYNPSSRTLTLAASRSCSQFNPASFTEDEYGELYIVALNPGTGLGVFKLVGTGSSGSGGGPAASLSATGCVQPSAPWQPIAAAVPYAVNAELWSDGLNKQRWMILPDGGTISATGNGDWTFPLGTVLVKQFSSGARRIETRLLVRHVEDEDWAGYTYIWNSAQSDATLQLAGENIDLGDGGPAWRVPSSAECLNCHTVAKGRSLGLETRQLNRTFTYPSGVTANQLSTLANIGLLGSSFLEPRSFAAFPHPFDATQPVGARARAYLHANCSHCHPAAGSSPNFLYDTSLAAMNVCGVAPSPAITGASSLVVPGNATQSGLNIRMKSLGSIRMPKLGSARVDSAATAVIDSWANGLSNCTGP
jgi:uncharacterized repeat protein (TIGR03806 family)